MKFRVSVPGWLLFPILGSGAALLFRPSERQWRDFSRTPPPGVARKSVALPDGQAIRLLGVPGPNDTPQFWLGEREVRLNEFRVFDPGVQGVRGAANVSLPEAKAFCEWLSDQSGRRVRLPTWEERRLAASGGVATAEFPWGFGGRRVPGGVHFGMDEKPARPGSAFGHGFRDLAGGVWEWLGDGSLTGGAWSERDPDTLRLDHRIFLPAEYRDADVGFRVLVEAPP